MRLRKLSIDGEKTLQGSQNAYQQSYPESKAALPSAPIAPAMNSSSSPISPLYV